MRITQEMIDAAQMAFQERYQRGVDEEQLRIVIDAALAAIEPDAWLGGSSGFKSFTRIQRVAATWEKSRIKVTPVVTLAKD